ncbi:MAG: 16S rRNA (cytosine(1402)-N(4))-methyltransferase RsmH [Clostridium sp.]|nr:16S rRNA (cytosine(1402)-N(4))-methyltransferase RsmH [Clostridium sp.]MCM1444721.1 16S rRNA (cytosine(1402)-N(4))-methyltransferase RsmH [Candidatus Amulumruptor caecigallinarius]
MHISVLLDETIKYLDLKETDKVIDATLGFAGHSSNILKRIKKGFLFAFDQDITATNASNKKLQNISNNFEIINTNFVNMKDELYSRNIREVDKILYDLGVSSPQLDEKDRGFSFHNDAVLDMRMDRTKLLTAKQVVNTYSYEQLYNIFYKYGEEKYSKNIAKKIIEVRNEKEINTTLELVEIIKNAVPEKYKREHHPARKIFQAIRIEVNDELNVFEKSLKDSLDLISIGGRICVITFHSLEDKICKKIFNDVSKIDKLVEHLPMIPEEYMPKFKVVATVEPTKEEIERNKRSRSAKLRVIERIK